MPRGTELSADERATILDLDAQGLPKRKIAQEMGRCISCIRSFLADPETYGTKKRLGRPRRLSPEVELQILDAAWNQKLSAGEIIARLQLNISVRQLQRFIRETRLAHDEVAASPAGLYLASADESKTSDPMDVLSFMYRPSADDGHL
ncbi:hypothetical protein ACHHYP_13163 [Achlya hypogyna]|uniref:Tc3 transposase DNA binding domain-containing protein n=1 Tax=Achlya hypogyna TaxID=1202772 RepID=A0A1V9ZGB3_ACHHY|nr:hypothetical protein ACHHYP_13163 [Achlya hypogyna]